MKLRRETLVPVHHSLKRVALVVVAALGIGSYYVNRWFHEIGDAKHEIAQGRLEEYVERAYPMWRLVHATGCPTIAELDDLLLLRTSHDPWGTPYVLYCGEPRPDSRGVIVISAGPDHALGTDDDLSSW